MNYEEALEVADEAVFVNVGRRLSKVEIAILKGSWEDLTYEQIASEARYSVAYVKRHIGPELWKLLTEVLGEKVSKSNFRFTLERRWRKSKKSEEARETPEEPQNTQFNPLAPVGKEGGTDWREPIDVSLFYGRIAELNTLEQWLLKDRCRLVALLGMGGIGKTSLAAKLAKQVQGHFDGVIWRSLYNAPPLSELLADLIQVFCKAEVLETDLPKSVEDRIGLLLEYLQSSRYLIILDNAETILQSCAIAGSYREGYEEYAQFIKFIGEVPHTSCLLLTSREKPKDVAFLEGKALPVRSLQLSGLDVVDGQKIFEIKGLCTSESELTALVERYAGNALALKIVATTILDVFHGNSSEFLKQNTAIFGNIYEILDQQFSRLSNLEKHIMYWLAVNREPVSLSELQDDIVSLILREKLLEALESLIRRALIEKSFGLFTLQPVVMEYVTSELIQQGFSEILNCYFNVFKSYALIKATAKDYIRNIQVSLIVKPIIERLLTVFITQKNLINQLNKILETLQKTFFQEQNYVAGNIINMLCYLKADLSNYDFSHLIVRQADLRNVNLHNVNFAHANLAKSVFAETFDGILSLAFSPNQKFLALGDMNGEIRLYQVSDWRQLNIFRGHTDWVTSIAFSGDSSLLASGSEDKTVKIWDVKTGECLRSLQGHTSWVWSVAFSPDGQMLASGSHDHTVKLWNISNGKCLRTLHQENHGVLSVAFSPDGLTLASGGDDHTVRLWDVFDGQCLRTLEGHMGWVWSITFSPDGQILSSGSGDHTVKLWDVPDGQCLRTLEGHTGWVWSIAFSPDGQILSSGSMDQTVKLWDVKTGRVLKTLQGHSQGVLSVIFTPSGQTLISSSEDETLRIWDVPTGECRRILRSKRLYEGMNIANVTGLTEATITTLKTLGALECELETSKNGRV